MIQPYTRLLAIAAMGALLAGCASEQPEDTTEPEVIEVDTSTESGTDSSTSTGVTDESGYQGAELDDPNSLLSDRFVYFEFNKSDVLPEDRPVIEAHANYLQRNPGATLSLEGHADERGADDYNLRLTRDRAASVVEAVVQRGVARDRLRSAGYGERCPVDPRSNAEAWERNRRVEFKILATEDGPTGVEIACPAGRDLVPRD